jgi:hypothetical protein
MLQVRPHVSLDYLSLPDIDSSGMDTLTSQDQKCLDEIGYLLVSHKAHEKFGVSLLHSHFEIEDDEVLIESLQNSTYDLVTQPVPKSLLKNNVNFPVNLKFLETDKKGVSLVGLEYALEEALFPPKPLSNKDISLLIDLKKILDKHDRTNRFGLRVLNRDFNSRKDLIFLERCFKDKRMLCCNLTEKTSSEAKNTIQTIWIWEVIEPSVEEPSIQLMQSCRQSCIQVCTRNSDGIHDWGIHNSSPHT